ncbi:hypothetical protein U1Q18_041667, partial [Sarracenia purpurea var. burkii]
CLSAVHAKEDNSKAPLGSGGVRSWANVVEGMTVDNKSKIEEQPSLRASVLNYGHSDYGVPTQVIVLDFQGWHWRRWSSLWISGYASVLWSEKLLEMGLSVRRQSLSRDCGVLSLSSFPYPKKQVGTLSIEEEAATHVCKPRVADIVHANPLQF